MLQMVLMLWRHARVMVTIALLSSVVAGVANTLMIGMINHAINNQDTLTHVFIWYFVALVFLVPLASIVSQAIQAHFSQTVLYELRMTLVADMLGVPLRRLEERGSNKIMAALTTDVSVINQTLVMLPGLIMQLVIILSCLAYLAWLFWVAAVGVVINIILGLSVYWMVERFGKDAFEKARLQVSFLFRHFDSLTRGTKELMLNRERKDVFVNKLLRDTARQYLVQSRKASIIYAFASNVGRFIFFAAVGFYVFIIPSFFPNIGSEVLTGYAIVLLYLLSPIEFLTAVAPIVSNATISLGHVNDLGVDLNINKIKSVKSTPITSWNELSLKGVTHGYHLEHEDISFTMGPIDLTFKRGELVFLVGGNGSGKTTLAKLILGLYLPEAGAITLDGMVINNQNREDYRQLFSAVFVDFYLFDKLIGLENIDSSLLDERAEEYLKLLRLDNKVTVKDGQLSTTNLSQGQRKRLTLLVAYLEDRPIYLFDEWAADQDPTFKKFFYRNLIPDLKARGKTLLIISHDDAYYDVADRLIRLDYGKVEQDTNLNTHPEVIEAFAETHKHG